MIKDLRLRRAHLGNAGFPRKHIDIVIITLIVMTVAVAVHLNVIPVTFVVVMVITRPMCAGDAVRRQGTDGRAEGAVCHVVAPPCHPALCPATLAASPGHGQ